MSEYQQRRIQEPPYVMPPIFASIKFDSIKADLFDEIANQTAIVIADSGNKNKSTQLRKYYDEFCMWDQKIEQDKSKYVEYLPLIKMLNAKVAYAKGRDLVDRNFVELIRICMKQLDEKDEKTFKTCKLFFEAFMGFYKMHKPK